MVEMFVPNFKCLVYTCMVLLQNNINLKLNLLIIKLF